MNTPAVSTRLITGLGVAAAAVFFGAGLGDIDGNAGYSGLSQRFLPIVVTLALSVCAILLLIGQRPDERAAEKSSGDTIAEHPARVAGGTPAPDDPDAADPRPAYPALALVGGGLMLHMALIGHLGFIIASSLLLVMVSRAFGSRRLLRDALVALGLTVPMWLLFARLLGIGLPLLPLAGI